MARAASHRRVTQQHMCFVLSLYVACFVVHLLAQVRSSMEALPLPGRSLDGHAVLVDHLRKHNCIWGNDVLLTVVTDLAAEDIKSATALHCVELSDVSGAESWPRDVWDFMRTLTQTCPLPNVVPQEAPLDSRAPVGVKRALELTNTPASVLDVSGAKPLAALALLKAQLPTA